MGITYCVNFAWACHAVYSIYALNYYVNFRPKLLVGSQTADQPGGAPVQEYPEDGGFPGDLSPALQRDDDFCRYVQHSE